MRYLKELKRRKIIEICFWLFFVGITYYLWDFPDIKQTAAYYTENSLIEVVEDKVYSKILYAISDEMAQKLPKYHLVLQNTTYRHENYKLYIGIPQTIATDHLKIAMAEVQYISEKTNYADNEYTYYLLDTNSLTAAEKIYEFRLYNDEQGENFVPYQLKFIVEKES